MAEKGPPISALKKTFGDIEKAQKSIDFYNTKIAKHDPFSARNIQASKNAMLTWNKVERDKNKLLEENDKWIKKLSEDAKQYNKQLKTTAEVDVKQVATLKEKISLIRKEQKSRGGYQSLIQRKIMRGNDASSQLQNDMGIIETVGAGAAEGGAAGAAAAAAYAAAKKLLKSSVVSGWNTLRGKTSYAMYADPGELGGRAVDPVTGKPAFWRDGSERFYGDLDEGPASGGGGEYNRENKRFGSLLGVRTGQALTLNQLELTQEDVWNTAAGLRGAGIRESLSGAGSSGYAAAVLNAQGRLGVEQSFGLKSAAATGAAPGKSSFSGDDIAEVAMQAKKLGLSGSRANEYADSIVDLTKAAQQTAENTDPKAFQQVMWQLNKSGSPALMGSRGGQFAMGLQDAIMNPGGGTAGKMLMLSLAGMGKNTDFMGALYKQSEGLPGMKPAIDDMLKKMSEGSPGGIDNAVLTLSGLTNNKNYSQIRSYIKSIDEGKMPKYSLADLDQSNAEARASSGEVLAKTGGTSAVKATTAKLIQILTSWANALAQDKHWDQEHQEHRVP